MDLPCGEGGSEGGEEEYRAGWRRIVKEAKAHKGL